MLKYYSKLIKWEIDLHFFRGGYTLFVVRLVVSLTGRKAVNGYNFW